MEAQRVQQPRNEQPREESNKKAQEQRRDEDACNIDLADHAAGLHAGLCLNRARRRPTRPRTSGLFSPEALRSASDSVESIWASRVGDGASRPISARTACSSRSEEHTSELQSLMRISYAVFCLKKKKRN